MSSNVTHEVKRRVCRYCMHQHLKVRPAGGVCRSPTGSVQFVEFSKFA